MFSIVVVNWNSGELLERCVRSLLRCAPDCEIVLIDNASQDASFNFIEGVENTILVMRNSRNAGFAAACNQGWRAAHGDLILFLNPDAEALPGSIAALAGQIEKDPQVWAIGGRLLDDTKSNETSASVRAFPSVASVAAEMLLLDEIWPRNPWTRRYRMADWKHDSARDVDQPAAACLVVRRSALESLGGFDEDFWPAWFEDVDLCRRIRTAGGRIGFEPRALFSHHGAVSLRSLTAEEFMRFYYSNMIRYFVKHHGRTAAARVRRLIIAGLYLRACAALLGASLPSRTAACAPRSFWRVARSVAGSLGARA